MAEIKDDKLFTQPDGTHLGECPICCLPLPLDQQISDELVLCKRICRGCEYANYLCEWEEGLENKCAYCGEPVPKTQEEGHQKAMKRVKANDPVALHGVGSKMHYHEGSMKGTMREQFNIIQRQLNWGM